MLLGLQRSGEIGVPLAMAITRELTLTGSFRFNDEIDDVVRAMADSSFSVDAIITHTFDAEDALTAFAVAGDPAKSSKVLLRFGSNDGTP